MSSQEHRQGKINFRILLVIEIIGWILLLVPSHLVKPFGVTNAFVGLLAIAMILTPPLMFFITWLGYLYERSQRADELEEQVEEEKDD